MIARTITFIAIATLAVVIACSTPAANDQFLGATPDEASFAPVAQLFVHRCGTFDCHGAIARNLRVYGNEGRRWSAMDRPNPYAPSTPDEIDQTYVSLVGLEPEKIDAVVRGGGANAEQLSMIQKARGDALHKGGPIWANGDDADTCVTSWLAGSIDSAACARANAVP
jgi:hypothetical protein